MRYTGWQIGRKCFSLANIKKKDDSQQKEKQELGTFGAALQVSNQTIRTKCTLDDLKMCAS